ncbi:hypothetical protein CASFOL_041110 [Castilleja foliolosa]|uniref:3-hydroxyisobutyryl-CoA hydrolase n=1 Tax=Castilleja foliolosa TaxID=1961234 RepID=A0ABD3BDW5_9LAMI
MASTNRENDQVLVEEKSFVRVFTLNRPKQLNALSGAMVSRLSELFHACADDSSVKLIILKGKGRAAINVSILNGIVMGGGVGASIHGRFRVATENTLFAMPETALGHFTDVGASYFLSRLPGFFGEYVGLTGTSLDGAEMLACGLATHFVPSERLSMLEEALVKADSTLKMINKCFSRRTVEEIIANLEIEVADKNDDWISSTIRSLMKASPISLKISLRSIREGRLEGIGKCLVREFRIVYHLLQGVVSKDHIEGCRAILIDKDMKPKWMPSKIESVSNEMVDCYFSKIDDDDDREDLKLPVNSNLPAYVIAKL